MAVEIITLKRLPLMFGEILSISMTADLKLLSVLTKQQKLTVCNLSDKNCENLTLQEDITTYSWQEDVSYNSVYGLLCITTSSDLVRYQFDVQTFRRSNESISVSDCTRWSTDANIQTFLASQKANKRPKPTDILKYEAREAIICYDRRYVVTFFLSSVENLQIMSFTDVCESASSARKICLVKETIFVLNHTGTVLSAYSVLSNLKVLEVDLMKCKYASEKMKSAQNFIVSLEKDIVVFSTEYFHLYYMVLNDYWDSFAAFGLKQSNNLSAVTAFAKQFPSVQRVDEGYRRPSISHAAHLLQPLVLACNTKDLRLKHIALYNGKLCFLFSNDVSSLIGIHKLGTEASTMYKRVQNRWFIVQSSSETFPLLLMHESNLSILLYDVEQNTLINELMLYQYSGSAEALSKLNSWQNIVIDLEILKQGLINRQLDAVKFFIRSREERYCQILNERDLSCLPELKSECKSWTEIMNLLLSTINISILNPSSERFVAELLQIANSASVRLLQVIDNSLFVGEDEQITSEKNEALQCFCKYLKTFQSIEYKDHEVQTHDDDDDEAVDSIANEIHYPVEILNQWKDWSKKSSWEEIIKESLLKGNISTAQSYFLNNDDVTFRSYGRLESFCHYGLDLVSQFLKQGLLPEAVIILTNLGIPVNDKLKDIFMTTCDCEIRQILTSELKMRNLLSSSDVTIVNFVTLLEKLYPCTSFEHAKLLQEEKSSHLEEWYKCAFPHKETPELIVGDFVESSGWNNCETGGYCCVPLNLVSSWPDDVRERILLPHFLKGSCDSTIQISPLSVWNYLLEYGDLPLISKWISNWLGNLQNNSPKEFPYEWPLNESMINCISQTAPTHVAEAALNELARFGIFCDDELEDISVLLDRAGKACCDLSDESVYHSSKATIFFADFSHRVVHYCLKHNLIHFLFDFWTRSYERFVVWPTCQLCDVPILKMLKAFIIWSQKKEDIQSAYNAMLASAEKLCDVSQLSPETLLTCVPVPLNIAISLYYPGTLHDIIRQNPLPESKIKSLKDALLPYPLLYDTLFNVEGDRQLPEVSLYQLLQDNLYCDVSKLFGWQSTNLLKSEESSSELPHFALEKLCEQHGLKEAFTHFYYLINGRPNFAYLKFMTQEMSHENRVTLPRVHLACKQIHNFALSHFRNEKICAACVLFIEMLGQDSLPLRICLICANMLYDSHNLKHSSEDAEQKIGFLFESATKDKETAMYLIKTLEAEVFKKWQSSNSKNVLDEISLWMPLAALARTYDVSAGGLYLVECAKHDSWLKFLVFSQIFQIPKSEVLLAASKFSNPCIGNHLCKALESGKNSSSIKEHLPDKEQLRKKTDLRKSLYARLGVAKEIPAVHESSTAQPEAEEDRLSVCSESTSVSSDPETGSVVILKDLFSQMLYAHNTDVSWISLLQASYVLHNPVLSVLAAAYLDSDLLLCFTTWLSAAFPAQGHSESEYVVSPQRIVSTWNKENLEDLVVRALREHKILLLTQGIYLFLPYSPLLSLMQFLSLFLVYKSFDSSAESLKRFQSQLRKYRESVNSQPSYQPLSWVETMSILILKEAVINCNNAYERQLLLRHLYFTRFENSLSKGVTTLSFNKLYQMVQCLSKSEDVYCFEHFLLPPSNPNYKSTSWKSVKNLIERHAYNEAKVFSEVAGLPFDEVLLLQIKQDSEEIRKTTQWESLAYRVSFWKKTLASMKLNNLKPSHIMEFFKVQCQTVDRYGEKCFLMQLIIGCQKEVDPENTEEILSLKASMWRWCIKEFATELSPEECSLLLPSEGSDASLSEAFEGSFPDIAVSDEKEIEAVETILCQFLTRKDVNQASQVAAIFNHDCYDLNIVKSCLALAKGEIDVSSANSEERTLPESPWKSKRRKSVVSWASPTDDGLIPSQMDIIQAIESLSGKTEVASSICEQILVNYIIATVLNCDYDEVAKEVPFSLMKRILSSDYKDRFSLARSLITVHELEDDCIATFLSLEIYFSIKMIPESSVMLPGNKLVLPDDNEDILYNPSITTEGFQLTVKLCQDPSLLGKKLIELLSSVFDDIEASGSKSIFEAVELCICAHNCFTVACNVEGISQVLHKSKQVAKTLAKSENFALLVRLLTGVGRYSEMSYIFDILLEHGKFELLFGKKMKEIPNLRLSLLDYLKRCPSSGHYYSMFLETFSMYREIAEDAEMSARKRLTQLCKMSTDAGLQNELENILKELTHATNNYIQVNCLHQAQMCVQLARLVALQIHIHPTWVIGMEDSSVARCITKMNNFSQAVIVAEAYNENHLWGQAVHYNVILQENRSYLRELQAYHGVSESLIEEVAKSFQKLSYKTDAQVRNMKWILSFCANIEVKYNLANQLGFSDIVTELLMGEGGAFLQDITKANL